MVVGTANGIAHAREKLTSWLKGGYHLPIHPSVFLRLMELAKRPDASPNDYADIISTSNSLTTKILTTVNSSWFAVRQQVRSLLQAVNLLGMVNVRMLAVTHCLAAVHERVKLPPEMMEQYWRASLIKAEAARFMAHELDESVEDEAFLVGLMQDMVMPLMHQFWPELYNEHILHTIAPNRDLCRMEREIFGVDHGRAAALLGEALQMPRFLCDMMTNHHDREELRSVAGSDGLADAVYFSSLFPHVLTCWHAEGAAETADFIQHACEGETRSVHKVLADIEARYIELARFIRPVSEMETALPELLRQATGEVSHSSAAMVGQLHAMMSSATQVDSQLAAVNFQALRLQEQTQEDALTGELNRHGLEQRGSRELECLREDGQSLAVLFVDMDNFKGINDRFGHAAGDEALRHTVNRLRETFGSPALIGRYGGDEFVAMIGRLGSFADARELANRFLNALREGSPLSHGRPLPVSASVGGIWLETIGPNVEIEPLFEAADKLMYEAKMKGRDSVVFRKYR